MARLETALLDLVADHRDGPLHGRLEALLGCFVEPVLLARDTIGLRNQRLLRLHRDLTGAPIEACACCPHCHADNEFDVPEAALLALPPADAGTIVALPGGRTFRLPRVADLLSADLSPGAPSLPCQIALACEIEGNGKLDTAALAELGEAFDAGDPAANLVLTLDCAECGSAFQSAVDIAVLVAAGLERMAEGLLRDVNCIASVYGWSEAQIIDLPAPRRRRYVELIATRRAPGGLRRVEARG